MRSYALAVLAIAAATVSRRVASVDRLLFPSLGTSYSRYVSTRCFRLRAVLVGRPTRLVARLRSCGAPAATVPISPPPQARNVVHRRANGCQPLRRILLPREHNHLMSLPAEHIQHGRQRRRAPRIEPLEGLIQHQRQPDALPARGRVAASGTSSSKPDRAVRR